MFSEIFRFIYNGMRHRFYFQDVPVFDGSETAPWRQVMTHKKIVPALDMNDTSAVERAFAESDAILAERKAQVKV